jgi:hypothetical protein
LGQAVMRAVNGYGQVRALIRTASISLPEAREKVLQETVANLDRFGSHPPFKRRLRQWVDYPTLYIRWQEIR